MAAALSSVVDKDPDQPRSAGVARDELVEKDGKPHLTASRCANVKILSLPSLRPMVSWPTVSTLHVYC